MKLIGAEKHRQKQRWKRRGEMDNKKTKQKKEEKTKKFETTQKVNKKKEKNTSDR
jgi:hypothetical protein